MDIAGVESSGVVFAAQGCSSAEVLMNARSRAARAAPQTLAIGIAALLGLPAPGAIAANNWPVTSCLDDGTSGTLRAVVTAASTLSGDTVDLSTLSCPGGKI